MPASAATFLYVGQPLQGVGTTGFKNIRLRFTIPGTIKPNSSYSTQLLGGYYDGVNRLVAISNYLSRGKSFGGQLDSFVWVTFTTDAAGKPNTWTIKVDAYFQDALGAEGYELYINGPGNDSTCPLSACGYDSLYTTLPETLQIGYSFVTTSFGTLTQTS